MKILALYIETDSGLYRLWVQSWRSAGWTVGIISPREIQDHKNIKLAARARRAKIFCSARLINYGFKPKKLPRRLVPIKYGSRGWDRSALVLYPEGMTEAQIIAAR